MINTNKSINIQEADKSRFFDKNKNLTDEEKKYYKKFFKEHPEQEKAIKSWNYSLTKSDFDKVIEDFDMKGDKLPNETWDDLRDGWDYEYLGEADDYDLFFIYTHKASYTIASNNIGYPVWSPVSSWYKMSNVKKDYKYDRAKDLYSDAKWCTAMHHDDKFFREWVEDKGLCLVYCVGKSYFYYSDSRAKLAIALYPSGEIMNVWDAYDRDYLLQEDFKPKVYELLEENKDRFKECVYKLRHTHNYDITF